MSEDLKAAAEETFRLFDPDGDGLKLKDLGTVLRSLGLNVPAASLQELVKDFSSKRGLTALSFEDFQECVEKARQGSDKSAGVARGDLDGLRDGMQHFLCGKKGASEGLVRVADLVRLMQRMGDALTDEEADDFLRDVKSNCTVSNGMVDFEEVRSWVLS